MKILGTYWFNGGGIVRAETDEGIRYYIRGWDPALMVSEEQDTDYIAHYGNAFPDDAGDALFGVTNRYLARLHEGSEVVLPTNRQHAEAMVKVGMYYLQAQDE